MLKFDDFDLAVRSLTNGMKITVIVDDTGMPSSHGRSAPNG